jgi:hypothetical protein
MSIIQIHDSKFETSAATRSFRKSETTSCVEVANRLASEHIGIEIAQKTPGRYAFAPAGFPSVLQARLGLDNCLIAANCLGNWRHAKPCFGFSFLRRLK